MSTKLTGSHSNKYQYSGFTIVEVVLVLSISAMILLLVLWAIPNLQKSRRDTQRKSDLGRLISQLESYASNTKGNYPTADAVGMTNASSFVPTYMTAPGETWKDPTGNAYTFDFTTSIGSVPSGSSGTIMYRTSAQCSASVAGTLSSTSSSKDIAAVMVLDKGYACRANK